MGTERRFLASCDMMDALPNKKRQAEACLFLSVFADEKDAAIFYVRIQNQIEAQRSGLDLETKKKP
jgi:hypothetical protein